MKKSFGTILTIVAAVLAAAALFFYSKASSTNSIVFTLNIAGLICAAAFLLLGRMMSGKPFLSLLVSAAAVLMMAAFGYSLVTEVEVLGYLISGLRTWADVQYWAYFSVAALVSWLFLLVASFTGLGAEA
ncbi:MAG: hypothetical protein IKG66_01695 [Lachnospiraceae bacterium]|nr:hypothetical protein [Lachnospiraceae bacterium]